MSSSDASRVFAEFVAQVLNDITEKNYALSIELDEILKCQLDEAESAYRELSPTTEEQFSKALYMLHLSLYEVHGIETPAVLAWISSANFGINHHSTEK